MADEAATTAAAPTALNDTPFDFLAEVYNPSLIEDGAYCHLQGPRGDLYLDGDAQKQPSRVKVRSTASKAFDAYLDKIQRRTVDRQRPGRMNKAAKEQLLRDLKKDEPESFATLVVELDNVSRKQPGPITPPREELLAFARNPHHRWVVQQVLEFAADDANYGGEAGKADGADDQI